MFNIEEELKKLPQKPGVYIMHNAQDEIIYVGKAIVLKNRVRQYFQSSKNKSSKIIKMVSQISYFEYIITDSELEALVLESNLIKEHQPKYNTMLKDDKSYPYIKVTVCEDYPRVFLARKMKRDKSKYFGPYTSGLAVKDTIELLRKLYKIRTCSKVIPNANENDRPCLYYHMKQCDAPCQGYISKEEYKEKINHVLDFLNGNTTKVLSDLEEKMSEFASRLDFEKAAEYRDLINSVKQISQKQKITNSDQEDRDVIAIAKAMDEAVVSVFFVREGKLLGREHFHMTNVSESSRSEIVASFIKQYYSGTPFIPRELMLEEEIDKEEEEVISEWLSSKRGQKVHILVPQKGDKHKLVELAAKNASMILIQDGEKIKREEKRTTGAVKEISDLLGIGIATRMEAYDISNISGFQTVASMVVYEDGKPKRSDYRKFRIKSTKGPDDYKSMEEVLTRRFVHGMDEREKLDKANVDYKFGSFTKYPDIILMDGGKGQVNVAIKVLESLKINIPVCGMVKDDNHRTRGLYYNNEELLFEKNSEAFLLLTRIQDEAHRFAIEYHKLLRGKNQIHSVLDDINGVGPTRRKALMKEFKDIEVIKNADIDMLMMADGITKNVAQEIYNFFH